MTSNEEKSAVDFVHPSDGSFDDRHLAEALREADDTRLWFKVFPDAGFEPAAIGRAIPWEQRKQELLFTTADVDNRFQRSRFVEGGFRSRRRGPRPRSRAPSGAELHCRFAAVRAGDGGGASDRRHQDADAQLRSVPALFRQGPDNNRRAGIAGPACQTDIGRRPAPRGGDFFSAATPTTKTSAPVTPAPRQRARHDR